MNDEKPYRDRDWLTDQFDQRDTLAPIARKAGCHGTTISRWGERFGLYEPERPSHGVYYSHDSRGYPTVLSREPGGPICIRVHRLVGIADGGDPHEIFNRGLC